MIRRVLNVYAIRFVREVIRRFGEDQSAVICGYISYASMLAGFPFLIFCVSLASLVIGRQYSDEAFRLLFEAVPQHVALTLEPVLRDVITARAGSILTLSALGTIYGASNGVEAIRIGLDRAYDVEVSRGFILNRLISIGFVLIGFMVFGTLSILIIFAPYTIAIVEAYTTVDIPAETRLARYGVGAVLLYATIWMMHRFLPDRPMTGLILWPGVFVSMAIWFAAAMAFSFYVANFPTYTLTYGALAGVIITLLFFYLTGIAIMFGAQVNAVLNYGVPDTPPPKGKRLWAPRAIRRSSR